MNVDWAVASCTRVSIPSTPAIPKMTKAVAMKRRPKTEWLTAARRRNPGPVAHIAASCRCNARAEPAPCDASSLDILIISPSGCVGFCDRSVEVHRRMYDDVEPHPAMAISAEFVAKPLIATRHVGLNAKQIHVPWHCIDLAGKPRNPKSVNDVEAPDGDIDRHARGQVHHPFSFDPAMTGVEERPGPLMCDRFDTHRLGGRARQ